MKINGKQLKEEEKKYKNLLGIMKEIKQQRKDEFHKLMEYMDKKRRY